MLCPEVLDWDLLVKEAGQPCKTLPHACPSGSLLPGCPTKASLHMEAAVSACGHVLKHTCILGCYILIRGVWRLETAAVLTSWIVPKCKSAFSSLLHRSVWTSEVPPLLLCCSLLSLPASPECLHTARPLLRGLPLLFLPLYFRVGLSWMMTGWDMRSCCPGEDHSHGLPIWWLLPGEGSRVCGGRRQCWGIALLWDLQSFLLSWTAFSPARFQETQQVFDLLEDGNSHKVHVQPELRAQELSCLFAWSLGLRRYAREVSCLLLATSSHTDAQGFVQPCGELGQGNDPIKSCAEQHQKQDLTRRFPNAAQMLVLVKEGFGPGWEWAAVDGAWWDGFFWWWYQSTKTCWTWPVLVGNCRDNKPESCWDPGCQGLVFFLESPVSLHCEWADFSRMPLLMGSLLSTLSIGSFSSKGARRECRSCTKPMPILAAWGEGGCLQ